MITIYLDSSDYSNLTKEDHSEILAEFVSLKNSGQACFRYSYITVSELVHTELKHKENAVKRAQVLEMLCGDYVLSHSSDLLFKDCMQFLTNQMSGFPQYAYNDSGIYYPEETNHLMSFKSDVAKLAKELVIKEVAAVTELDKKKAIKRVTKKIFQKGAFTQKNRILTKGFELAVQARFPFINPQENAALFSNYYKGKISEKALIVQLQKLSFKPVNLTSCTIGEMERGLEAFQWLRRSGTNLSSSLATLRNQFLEYESLRKSDNAQIKRKTLVENMGLNEMNYRQGLLSNCWESQKDRFRRAGITFKMFSRTYDSPLSSIPSADISQQIIEAYVKQTMLLGDRELLTSDFGDIVHSSYLPYVDYFRADKFMTRLIQPIAAQYKTIIFPTLKELVEALKQLPSNGEVEGDLGFLPT